MVSCILRGGWGGLFGFIPVGEECLPPLSRFDAHLQAKLETFETKMAARSAKRSISTILRKNRGL